MRLLHTSDWHLGHTLHGVARDHEHEAFLAWLLDTLASEAIDALLLTGDVFETHNPGAAAQAAWYGFLASAKQRLPGLQIVVVGGNHDSADRLNAPKPLLDRMAIHVVGGLPRRDDDTLDLDRLLVPLRDQTGTTRAWVAAVPFLRTADLRLVGDPATADLAAGVRSVYDAVLAGARARREAGQALIATGHCYMVGTELSELSERRILGGNQHALPVDIFPEDLTYVALGHLHKAQAVGRSHVRYAGSPLPLSMAELDYLHQVTVVTLDGEGPARLEHLPVPRLVPFARVPARGTATPAEVCQLLRRLPGRETVAREELRPYLEVRVRLEGPEPRLKADVEAALEGKAHRLLTIRTETPHHEAPLGGLPAGTQLAELAPGQVFERLYRARFSEAPPPELLQAFHTLFDDLATG
ncbi:MAG: exonuclease SbcCD subunit D C-terminal domain-containing protein [Candidatus Sericytochromatia bacterium]|nr:exonuclease SbcCD subunit D C-terminal domain-containing protein [Candidatus Sericytochromatia bacterium]